MSIVEVAKFAGVSTATVSRVLNGLPGVRAETVAQVQAAVSELSYTPQRVHAKKRRPPRRGKPRTGNIAVITVGHDRSWLGLPVLASVVTGIQRATESSGMRLLLGDMPDPSKFSPLLKSRQVDGAVVFLSSDVPTAQLGAMLLAMQKYVPVVWAMGMEMMAGGVDHVTPDNVSIGQIAFNHLAGLGCRRLAFLTADPKWPLMRLRGQAFTNSAVDGGFSPSVYMVSDDARVAEPYGRRVEAAPSLDELIQKMAKAADRPDGLFVATDWTTASVYPLLAKYGVRPGKDLRLVSCDNEEARLSGMHPRPASIDIGAEEVGFRAVHRLLNRIDRPHGLQLVIQVSPRLVAGAPVA